MSWQRPVLNRFLRWFEKRHLARVRDPAEIRAGFETKARFWFRPPRGSTFRRTELGGVPVLWAQAGPGDRGVLLYLHGGGYVFGSPDTHRAMLARLSQLTGMRACLPDYRLAPEHAFPAAFDDARAVYDGLLADGIAPARIVLGGDSAGGGLALALLGDLVARGQPLPRAAFAFSPLTDMSFSGDSLRANAAADVMLPAARASEMADMYLQGHDPRDPRASPLFADFTGAPPVWLSVGDTEILLADTTRLAVRLRDQGVAVSLNIAQDLPHVWPLFQRLLPEADATLADLAQWIRRQPSPSADS